jgi:hypothetical protein
VARSTTQVISIDPTMVEAWATLQALLFCREIGLFDIILEGDAMQIVTTISTDLLNWSRFEHFIEGIKKKVLLLRSFRLFHVRRDANSTAHMLAKATSSQARDTIWLEEVPSFTSDIVCKEAYFLIPSGVCYVIFNEM